jgi:oligopeptidase B
LVDRGFIYAVAHIRGGDDLGFKWYEDAKFLNKRRTFEDFIACAEYLIEEKYTSKGNIVIAGGSAGGMLVGATMNMATDLYKAVVAHVPFVDVLNTMLDESLPLTPGEFKEWGNPKYEEFFRYILSYSPYDNVEAKPYPHIFVTAGLTDPRVTYWEPAKWVAKLRELKTNENLLLFKTNMDAGHGGASGRFDYLKEVADEYAFIMKVYGLKA